MSARRRRRAKFVAGWRLLLFAAGGMLGGVLVFHLIIMPIFVRHGSEVAVPDLRGLDPKEASERLTAAGLCVGEERHAYDDRVSAGLVARQDPPAGFQVKKGREVHLSVSLGLEAMRVPDLIGESVDHARFVLSQRGLSVGAIRAVHGEAGGSRVVASLPPSDSALMGQQHVDLLVDAGRAPVRYLMPDLRGLDAERTAMELEDAGFEVRLSYGVSRTGVTGQVIEQLPRPGHPVDENGPIELTSAR